MTLRYINIDFPAKKVNTMIASATDIPKPHRSSNILDLTITLIFYNEIYMNRNALPTRLKHI